ncbi:MAG TPA: glycerophosphodiester phosphodiesterase family protein [Blastocatellia bacterium]|nr:glycerophosphodiester phosphodiesterase family protein [Blastocatellia bacterium]
MKLTGCCTPLARRWAGFVVTGLVALLTIHPPASRAAAPAPPRPLIIAHRGGALESTENTIAAFQRAFRIGADGIETDIRLTRDGMVVVYHDDYFGRVEGLPQAQRTRLVSDMTYGELTAQTLIPVGEDTGGRRVPTLSDLLAQVHGRLLNIELKRCARFEELVKKTIAILKGYAELDRIVLEAPDLDTAKKLRKALGPQLKLHINPEYDHTAPLRDTLKQLLKFKPHSVSISYKLLARDMVESAHRAGVEVWVWTVNDTGVAERMRELGADAIKTDRPTTLMNLFRGDRTSDK